MAQQHDARHWPLTCPDTKETIRSYAEYLKSKHWQRVKILFRASPQHKGRCYICRGADKLHLHHRTYERIGRELLTDLQELCERCHSLVHQTAEIGAASGITIANAADMLLGDGFRGMKREAPKGRKDTSKPNQPNLPKLGKRPGRKAPTPPADDGQASQYFCGHCRKLVDPIRAKGGQTLCSVCGIPVMNPGRTSPTRPKRANRVRNAHRGSG